MLQWSWLLLRRLKFYCGIICISTDVIFSQNKITEQNRLAKLIVVQLVEDFTVFYGTGSVKEAVDSLALIPALTSRNPLFVDGLAFKIKVLRFLYTSLFTGRHCITFKKTLIFRSTPLGTSDHT